MANYSADDVRDFLVDNRELLNDHLEHYGLPRRSGRYKWGSGKDPYQSTGGKRSFKKAVSAGERYIKSKLGSSKRAQKKAEIKAAKAREKEENEKVKVKALAKEQKNKYRNEKAYVKSLSDEELRRIINRDAMESQYLSNHSQKKPFAKKMVDMAVKEILIPAVRETVKDEGKKYVKKNLKELQNMLNTAKKSNKKK